MTTVNTEEFEVASGKIRITDPFYSDDVWCKIDSFPAKNGKWKAYVVKSDEGDWGIRCAVLIAYHEDHPVIDQDEPMNLIGNIGVDSGQAGIFDEGVYPRDNSTGEYDDTNTFYGQCCKVTLSEDHWGTIPGGVVSSSGYGDGSYQAFGNMKNGKYVAIKIVFIEPDECLNEDSEED